MLNFYPNSSNRSARMTTPSDVNMVFELILELPGITVTDVIIEDDTYRIHCESTFDDVYCPITLSSTVTQ